MSEIIDSYFDKRLGVTVSVCTPCGYKPRPAHKVTHVSLGDHARRREEQIEGNIVTFLNSVGRSTQTDIVRDLRCNLPLVKKLLERLIKDGRVAEVRELSGRSGKYKVTYESLSGKVWCR